MHFGSIGFYQFSQSNDKKTYVILHMSRDLKLKQMGSCWLPGNTQQWRGSSMGSHIRGLYSKRWNRVQCWLVSLKCYAITNPVHLWFYLISVIHHKLPTAIFSFSICTLQMCTHSVLISSDLFIYHFLQLFLRLTRGQAPGPFSW